jgi:tryptophanyl-tRNA synthetase
MRSTGKLHLGNYVGALENWVRMQDTYDCFFFIADWHALTTDYADTSRLKENSVEVLLDWLAAGLDPEKCVMFIQSHVPAHAELHLLLSMITPLGWRPDLQGADGKHHGKGLGNLWFSRLSSPAIGRYIDL